MKVRVKQMCYYDNRIRKADSIIEFNPAHKGEDENGKRTIMPFWAEIVDQELEEKEPKPEKKPEPTTIHEMAGKKISKVATPNTKKKG